MIGFPEVLLILIIVLILFGPKKIPELAYSIGKAIRAYKEGLNKEPKKKKKNPKG